MKFLFVFRRLGGGGVTTGAIDRLNYLSKNKKFQIHVLSELESNPEILKNFSPEIHFHVLPISHLVRKKRMPIVGFFQLLKEVKKVYQKLIDEINPDVITGFNFGYNKEILSNINTEATRIVELRGSYASAKLLKKKKNLIDYFKTNYTKLHNAYDYAILISKEDMFDRSYLKIPKKHIYNSVIVPDLKNLIPIEERRNVILAVGTLSHNKNFKDLIIAASIIKEALVSWEIHIYGIGPEEKILSKLIKKKGIEEIVKLKGFNYNMDEVYQNTKILISTSISEGFGRTIAEALAFKVPVIAYDCKCGPKEIISDNVNGFLIDFNPAILAEKIKILINNPAILKNFSENCHFEIDKFEHSNIMEEWVKFYDGFKKS